MASGNGIKSSQESGKKQYLGCLFRSASVIASFSTIPSLSQREDTISGRAASTGERSGGFIGYSPFANY